MAKLCTGAAVKLAIRAPGKSGIAMDDEEQFNLDAGAAADRLGKARMETRVTSDEKRGQNMLKITYGVNTMNCQEGLTCFVCERTCWVPAPRTHTYGAAFKADVDILLTSSSWRSCRAKIGPVELSL